MKNKKAQLEIGFNWIYVLIAGTVILMFFIGIVVKQKIVSEEKLSAEVIQRIEGIFTGAGLSENTATPVEVPDITLRFSCDGDTGYSDYAVYGTSVKAETPWQPIFSSERVPGKRLFTWTLEWKYPFKVINYLFVSSPEIKYYLFSNEILLPEVFNYAYATGYGDINYINEEQIRLVFKGDLVDGGNIPSSSELYNVPDEKVTAVAFVGSSVIFYEKFDDHFVKKGEVPLLGSLTKENPNFYGAIFSDDIDLYVCNIQKALRRLEILSLIYGKRIMDIQNQFVGVACGEMVGEDLFYGASNSLEDIAHKCQSDFGNCLPPNTAQEIENKNLYYSDHTACPVIY